MMLAFLAGTAVAEPRNGFGLNAAWPATTGNAVDVPVKHFGLSLGIDYQFALSDKWSISPFDDIRESVKNVSDVTAGHGILGAQLRYWAGSVFSRPCG